jgi:putative SOS response-associated peptidase YedK
MCGRFALTNTLKQVEELFGASDIEDFPPRYNIAPTQPILLVTKGFGRDEGSNLPDRRALLVRWGFIPGWAKNPNDMSLLINARSETATEKAAFKAAMRHRRSLIPASGFYEWKREGTKKTQPFWVRPKHGGLIAFAGLMETWLEPGGSEIDTGAILTTRANAAIAHLHERMPVVIEPRDFDRWLDCLSYEPRDVFDLMRPADPDFFEAIPISDKVNKFENTGPEIQEPIAMIEVEPKPLPKAGGQMSLF